MVHVDLEFYLPEDLAFHVRLLDLQLVHDLQSVNASGMLVLS